MGIRPGRLCTDNLMLVGPLRWLAPVYTVVVVSQQRNAALCTSLRVWKLHLIRILIFLVFQLWSEATRFSRWLWQRGLIGVLPFVVRFWILPSERWLMVGVGRFELPISGSQSRRLAARPHPVEIGLDGPESGEMTHQLAGNSRPLCR